MGMALQHFEAVVSRAFIYDYDLEIAESLAQYSVQRRRQTSVVVRRDTDADNRRGAHGCFLP